MRSDEDSVELFCATIYCFDGSLFCSEKVILKEDWFYEGKLFLQIVYGRMVDEGSFYCVVMW